MSHQPTFRAPAPVSSARRWTVGALLAATVAAGGIGYQLADAQQAKAAAAADGAIADGAQTANGAGQQSGSDATGGTSDDDGSGATSTDDQIPGADQGTDRGSQGGSGGFTPVPPPSSTTQRHHASSHGS